MNGDIKNGDEEITGSKVNKHNAVGESTPNTCGGNSDAGIANDFSHQFQDGIQDNIGSKGRNSSIRTDSANSVYLDSLSPWKMKSSLFSGILLAYWDNVMGPTISKLWLGNKKVTISEEIVNYVANHTLSGELCRQTERQTIDPKLYVLKDLGCVFCSVIFNGRSRVASTISSLSFIMAFEELDRYLLLQDMIGRQMKLLVLKYIVLQQKDMDTAVKLIASHLKIFSKTIDTLDESLQENICVKKTVFGELTHDNEENYMDAKFLMRCITSHLQTCGCTIVCGKYPDKVNMFVRTLLLFLSPCERYCSRYCSEGMSCRWIQDLFVQGLVKTEENILQHTSLCCKSLLLGSYPVTLIDMDKMSVQQTPRLSKHVVARKQFLKVVLGMMLKGIELPDYSYVRIAEVLREQGCSLPENLFTEDFGDMSVMVQRFITELLALPNKCSIKKNHISNFVDIVDQKAKTLLAYVESNSHNGKVPWDDSQMQQMKQDLLFTCQADYRIVLARAERMQPGIAVFMEGDLHQEHTQVSAPTMWR